MEFLKTKIVNKSFYFNFVLVNLNHVSFDQVRNDNRNLIYYQKKILELFDDVCFEKNILVKQMMQTCDLMKNWKFFIFLFKIDDESFCLKCSDKCSNKCSSNKCSNKYSSNKCSNRCSNKCSI